MVKPVAFDSGTVEIIDGWPASMLSTDILKRSKDSAAMLEYWDLTDTIVEGAAAIKLAADKYLPKFEDEGAKAYEFRLRSAKFTNIYRDILEGLAAKPFEEEISLVTGEGTEAKEPPEAISDLLEDIDGSGNNLTVFASLTFFNGINSALDWIFVDYPSVDPTRVRTVADAKAAQLRPFWSHVLGRNVFEAKTAIIGGKEVLTYMRIFEPGNPDCVRIFIRDESGVVRWALYEKEADVAITNHQAVKFLLVSRGVISIGKIPLVPFATGRRDGRTFKFFPAMRDAADLQIELYQAESGLKFAKTMTAYPMLAANGIRPQMEADGKTPKKVAIGPAKILYSAPDGSGNSGNWSYIEPGASSLNFLAQDVKDTTQNLRELGRQPLTAQSGNLTTITTAVAAGKAKSAVGAWALVLKNTIENALVLTCDWLGISEAEYSPEVAVYNDFDNFTEGNADLEHLRAMRDKGDLSQETLWIETKRRRVLSSEFDKEKEIERLLNEEPGEDEPGDVPPAPPAVVPPVPELIEE